MPAIFSTESVSFLLIAAAVLQPTEAQSREFCWKDHYTRGVGTIPDECPGRDKLGALCYDKCPSGYFRSGVDCYQHCPSGFRDDGLFCRRAEYGRGGGYPWKFGDAFNLDGARRRCGEDHDECEKWGAMIYPKCRPGYKPAGCCICRPELPDCAAEGLGGRFDLSCTKKIHIGKPSMMTCPSGMENDAGLCYKPCNPGYSGVGPVCWSITPPGLVSCGMGAATSHLKCLQIVGEQILSLAEVSLTTLLAAAPKDIRDAWRSGTNKTIMAPYRKAKAMTKHIYDTNPQFKAAVDLAFQNGDQDALGEASRALFREEPRTEADMLRDSAALLALFDTTGVTSVIAAFTFSKCSTIMGAPGLASSSGAPRYVAIQSGDCESHGYQFITDKAECMQAASAVGVEHLLGFAGGNRQKYCGTWGEMLYLHFNSQTHGFLNGFRILETAQPVARQICKA